jgi:uncharacterized repeat protein (TIGR01451 family)
MTSFLSTISSQFAKSLMIGTVCPVVLFLIFCSCVVLPYAGVSQDQLLSVLFPLEKDSATLANTLEVVVLTILLYTMNIPIIRMYEGYPWRKSWIGERLTRRQRRRFETLRTVRTRARMLRYQVRDSGVRLDKSDLEERQSTAALRLNSDFPGAAGIVLPTRLGNIIRSFEVYSTVRYGMESVTLWPRLLAQTPADYRESIVNAKTSFDFMLNCSFLSVLAALAMTALGIVKHHPFDWETGRAWLAWALSLGLLANIFYRLAANRATSWGIQVKGAFDLYRSDLRTPLGFTQELPTPDREKAFWTEVSYRLTYPDALNLPEFPYNPGTTWLTVKPSSVVVTLDRTVELLAGRKIKVSIVVRNKDQIRNPASDVTVFDQVPDGYRLVPDSFTISSGVLRLGSLQPLEFRLGQLKYDGQIALTYLLEPASKPNSDVT